MPRIYVESVKISRDSIQTSTVISIYMNILPNFILYHKAIYRKVEKLSFIVSSLVILSPLSLAKDFIFSLSKQQFNKTISSMNPHPPNVSDATLFGN